MQRTLTSILGLLAILINLAAPLGFSAPVRAADVASDGVTIICTAAGPVAVDSKGLPVPGRHPEPQCAFCLPLMQGALDSPAAVDTALAWENRTVGEARFCERSERPQPRTRSVARLARGPPFI